jgi:multimeric flavodoxin WrbA
LFQDITRRQDPMIITILDGNPKPNRELYNHYLLQLERELTSGGHEVQTVVLRDLDIRFCTGCWSCWWGPTPGECVFRDDSHSVCRTYIRSDLVIFVSPVIMGFVSALMKKVQDKLIPLLHPYIEFDCKECHHRKRYERYPGIGLILEGNSDTDDEDIEITTDMFHRFALNFKTGLVFTLMTHQPVQEVTHALDHI